MAFADNTLLEWVGFGFLVYLGIRCSLAAAHLAYLYYTPGIPVESLGRWGVVLGAGGGIGSAYASFFASKGMNVLLIDISDLTDACDSLKKTYGVEAKSIIYDASRQHGGLQQYLTDLDVGVIVCAAGIINKPPSRFLDIRPDPMSFARSICDVNIHFGLDVITHYLPWMLKKNKGAIIMISSGGGTTPVPTLQLYAATKVFVNYIMEALHWEYGKTLFKRSNNVHFQTLMPYWIQTEMMSTMGVSKWGSEYMCLSAAAFVKRSMNTLGKSRACYGSVRHTLQGWAHASTPTIISRSLSMSITRRMADPLLPKGWSIDGSPRFGI